MSYNGGVCTVREKNDIYSSQIKALTAKLMRLKKGWPSACLEGEGENKVKRQWLPLTLTLNFSAIVTVNEIIPK